MNDPEDALKGAQVGFDEGVCQWPGRDRAADGEVGEDWDAAGFDGASQSLTALHVSSKIGGVVSLVAEEEADGGKHEAGAVHPVTAAKVARLVDEAAVKMVLGLAGLVAAEGGAFGVRGAGGRSGLLAVVVIVTGWRWFLLELEGGAELLLELTDPVGERGDGGGGGQRF
jgi:hypothetical protein